jgi:hypothetical protein
MLAHRFMQFLGKHPNMDLDCQGQRFTPRRRPSGRPASSGRRTTVVRTELSNFCKLRHDGRLFLEKLVPNLPSMKPTHNRPIAHSLCLNLIEEMWHQLWCELTSFDLLESFDGLVPVPFCARAFLRRLTQRAIREDLLAHRRTPFKVSRGFFSLSKQCRC